MNTVERVTVYGHTSSLSDSVRLRHGSGGGRIGGGTSAVRARCGACTFIFTYIHIYIYNIKGIVQFPKRTRRRLSRDSGLPESAEIYVFFFFSRQGTLHRDAEDMGVLSF